MKIKNSSVKIEKLKMPIWIKFGVIEKVCKDWNGGDYECTITSGNDGKHMKGSKHYNDLAIDVRSRDMENPAQTTRELRKRLGDDYDILFETNHIHIEYDPKN